MFVNTRLHPATAQKLNRILASETTRASEVSKLDSTALR